MVPSIQAFAGCAPYDSRWVDKKAEHHDRGRATTSVGDHVHYAIQIVSKFPIPSPYPDAAGLVRGEKMSVRNERRDLNVLLHPAVSDPQQMGDLLRIVVCDGPDI